MINYKEEEKEYCGEIQWHEKKYFVFRQLNNGFVWVQSSGNVNSLTNFGNYCAVNKEEGLILAKEMLYGSGRYL